MERLLTIGEFAERCGLSRSALRFYDQNELLRPRLVDDETGYRYYAIAQLDRALLVRRLREAEMPVGILREYLRSAPEQRREMLARHLASVRRRASEVQDAIVALQRDLDAADRSCARSCRIDATELAQALGQVGFAVADPGERAELGAVWVETKDDSLRLVATDSYRLAVRDLVPEWIGPAGIRGVIDAAAARALSGSPAGGDTVVLAQREDGTMTAAENGRCRTVGGAGEGFPDYERILLDLPAGAQIALPRDQIERALADLPLRAPHVQLRFESDRLVLEASDRARTVAGHWPAAPLRVLLDRRFLAEAVTAMVGPDLVIEAFDPLGPVTLRSADTGTFAVLTMPVRPPHPAAADRA